MGRTLLRLVVPQPAPRSEQRTTIGPPPPPLVLPPPAPPLPVLRLLAVLPRTQKHLTVPTATAPAVAAATVSTTRRRRTRRRQQQQRQLRRRRRQRQQPARGVRPKQGQAGGLTRLRTGHYHQQQQQQWQQQELQQLGKGRTERAQLAGRATGTKLADNRAPAVEGKQQQQLVLLEARRGVVVSGAMAVPNLALLRSAAR